MWTTQKPTESGWYWWRGESDLNALICFVASNGGVMLVMFAPSTVDRMGGEWAGPIPEPKEPA